MCLCDISTCGTVVKLYRTCYTVEAVPSHSLVVSTVCTSCVNGLQEDKNVKFFKVCNLG